MADFHEKSINSVFAQNHNLKASHIQGLFGEMVKDGRGQVHNVNPEHMHVNLQCDATARQNPSSPTPISLIDGGSQEFRIEKGNIDVWDHGYYRYDLFNDSVSPITVTNSCLSLNNYQIFGQNGADLLFQETGLQAWLNLGMSLNDDEWAQMNARFGSNATYTSGAIIGAGETRPFYFPLMRLIAQAKLHLSGLNNEVIIRFNFNQSTLTVSTGGAVPKCTDSYLIMRGSYEPKAITDAKIKIYKSPKVLTVPYLHPQTMSQTLTLTASSDYSIVLSGITGLVAMIAYTIRASPLPNVSLGNFLDITDKHEYQSASGASIIGHYSPSDDESRTLIYPEKYDNRFNANSNFVVTSFAKSPVKALKYGCNDGYYPFTGFEKLFFRTSAGLAQNSYTVDVCAWVYSTAHIQNGQIRTRKP